MDKKEDANDLIVKMIKDACNLIVLWIKRRKDN